MNEQDYKNCRVEIAKIIDSYNFTNYDVIELLHRIMMWEQANLFALYDAKVKKENERRIH